MTISHRLSLLKYHDDVLKFDGKGHVQFEAIEHHLGHERSFSSLLGIPSSQNHCGTLLVSPNCPERLFTTSMDDAQLSSLENRSPSQQFLFLQQSFINSN